MHTAHTRLKYVTRLVKTGHVGTYKFAYYSAFETSINHTHKVISIKFSGYYQLFNWLYNTSCIKVTFLITYHIVIYFAIHYPQW